MSRSCQISGKRWHNANKVSNSNQKSKKRQQPNLKWKRFWWVEKKRWVRLRVCAQMLRTIDKIGLEATLHQFEKETLLE